MAVRTPPKGRLFRQAEQFSRDLETRQAAAVDQLLAAWVTAYQGTRQDLDTLLAKVENARAQGDRTSPAWLYQERRLRGVLRAAEREMAGYARYASRLTQEATRAALRDGTAHTHSLVQEAAREGLPGLDATFLQVDPAVLANQVGFLADGTVLDRHLTRTLPAMAKADVRDALVQGLANGWSQDKMRRVATRSLAVTHARATTILRTESLRAYRAAAQETMQANRENLDGWTWSSALDRRTCVACAVMHGTIHSVDETLDGHPRCRCAMVPRTKSWKDLGVDLPDTRPTTEPGTRWLETQATPVQVAIMGKAKHRAWRDGAITLDDMVARHDDPAWGTMRAERSLKSIREGRNGNPKPTRLT